MYATFNVNHGRTIVSCYSFTNASDELIITTDYHLLLDTFSNTTFILIGVDMNVQIGKDENNEFCQQMLPNRNDEYFTREKSFMPKH